MEDAPKDEAASPPSALQAGGQANPAGAQDDSEAVYEEAAKLLKQQDEPSARLLGLAMMRGAADAGHVKAQSVVGFELAQGTTPDLPAAVDYLVKAARSGDPIAIQNLRRLHDKLLDALPEERSKALAALVAAADEGSSAAAAELGFLYFHGSSGLPADPAKAQAYLRIGAEAGDADSANDLGVMFNEGLGVEQNYDTAAKFFQQAADGGHAKAQAVLGVAYAVGNGVPRDLVQAFKWMRLSALQGEAMGKNALADFIRGLSKEQITAGHKLVAEFLRARGQEVSIEQLNQEILNPPPPPTLQELMPKLSPGQVVPANPASTPKR